MPELNRVRGPFLRGTLFGTAVALAACSAPDRPPGLPEPLPAAVTEYLRPDSMRTVGVSDGVRYRYLWSPEGPWAVHLVQADLTRCDLGFEVVRAPKQPGRTGGLMPVSEMEGVAAEGGETGTLVAVNGDFFTAEGTPVGPELTAGGVRTPRSRPAFSWRAGSAPWIGQTRVEGDSVLHAGWGIPLPASRSVAGDPGTRAPTTGTTGSLVGGYPELLSEGEKVGDLLVGENPSFAAQRHPRTAVGWDPEVGRIWLVVVDGRQGGYSVGMSLPELARLFEALGATEAINLDGGGSSVLVVLGRRVSRPSDETGERAVVNALTLRRDRARYCSPFQHISQNSDS